MQNMFVISASSSNDQDSDQKRDESYQNFFQCCDEALKVLNTKLPGAGGDNVIFKLGGMKRLLLSLTEKEKLTDLEINLLQHVLEKQSTKDEQLLRNQITKVIQDYKAKGRKSMLGLNRQITQTITKIKTQRISAKTEKVSSSSSQEISPQEIVLDPQEV